MTAAENTLRAIGAGDIDADRPYRIFVDAMSDGAATISASGLILFANRRLAELLSFSRERIVGSRLAEFVAGDIPFELRSTHSDAALNRTFELALMAADGLTIPVLVGASPLDVDGAQLTCLTFTDLRALKAQAAEIARLTRSQAQRTADVREEFALSLAETQKLEALGVLAGGIAHDFNNLLTVILGNTSLALSTLPADAAERVPLEQVELAATRSTGLARQILAYSGKGKFVVEVVDLGDLVTGLTELIKAAISKKARLSFELAPGAAPIEADTTQVRQVVLNLITNASEAIGEDCGTISVRTGSIGVDRVALADYEFGNLPPGRYTFFEVADTGAGMDPETEQKIFDPFFTTKFTGRGLGLAAVRGIVRGHHGAMKVRSEPAKGTTFTIIFPESAEAVAAPAAHRAVAAVGDPSGTVLVAEDDRAVRLLTVRMLESMGFTVVPAVDGAEALRLFNERPAEFTFVMLDLMMPGMSGEEVVDELRQMGATTPIILSSGYNSQELSQRFVNRGVAAFLQKPYALTQLRATALKILADPRA